MRLRSLLLILGVSVGLGFVTACGGPDQQQEIEMPARPGEAVPGYEQPGTMPDTDPGRGPGMGPEQGMEPQTPPGMGQQPPAEHDPAQPMEPEAPTGMQQ
ncbi:MAG: hypothetical protein EA399_06040 [Desulfovibrionales bacterium]|nr:MAG: hypothetical protein EA399_06040 [Desulfovibrionales bacterium]